MDGYGVGARPILPTMCPKIARSPEKQAAVHNKAASTRVNAKGAYENQRLRFRREGLMRRRLRCLRDSGHGVGCRGRQRRRRQSLCSQPSGFRSGYSVRDRVCLARGGRLPTYVGALPAVRQQAAADNAAARSRISG